MHENFQALGELPIVGDYVAYEQDRLGFLVNCAKTYGRVARYSQFVYMIADSDLCEQVLMRTNQDFITPGMENIAGLTNLDFDIDEVVAQWRRNRSGLVRGLHSRTISPHFEQMVNSLTSSITTWRTGQVIAPYEEMRHLTSQITINYLFGAQGHPFLKTFNQFMDAHFDTLNNPFSFPPSLPTPLSLRTRARKKKLVKALTTLIQQDRIHPSEHPNLLSVVLQTPDAKGHPFTDNTIRGVMTAMLFQSGHTSFTTLSWIWYLLALHPEQERKMSGEIQQILGDRQLERADLSRFVYTECVIKEVLRLYPPVWQLIRDVTQTCRLNDYLCEKGQRLYLNVYSVHRDPRFFPEPDTFLPDRWLSERQVRSGTKCSYLPFGLGQRKCLGSSFAMTELLLITILIARRFRWYLVDAVSVRISPDIVLRPKNLKMRVELR